ncbi:Lysophospholipase [Cytospora mali]|uniref:Lysophospholipase n=1 Tax=Cytospora mali TaxID=578113 RepID=A0A194W2J9_CYTMA|nr:Lysophospholipase [Valsa mali]
MAGLATCALQVVACLLLSTTPNNILASASTLPFPDRAYLDAPRALPNSPSGGYAPAIVDCPSTRPTIRGAASLSQNETDWLTKRRAATVQPMADFMSRANISGFDAASYVNGLSSNTSALPNIAIAMSGGGYRALLNGAGFIAAADDRTPGTTDEGGIGGLLQASTYVAGLSGAGWLVGSIYTNNFSTVVNLRDGSVGSSIWQFDRSIFVGPEESGFSILNTVEYWDDIADAVSAKANAGFEGSITDYWGRALSYQLINATGGGAAYTFSSIALDESLINGSIPLPILVADGRAPGTTIVSLNATNYEINPWEMGSFDPTVYGFAPTRYLASNFSGGEIPDDGHCVEGFDNAGYMMGTSSSLFNDFLTESITDYVDVPTLVADAIEAIASDVGSNDNDIAQWVPNPFLGWKNATNPTAHTTELSLVDGGEDLQNIPLTPLIQPVRAVDVIFAVDSSADTTYYWPNATALRASYDRSQSDLANGTLFPPVPDANTFINLGLNNRPTFFGCNASNFTLAAGQSVPPLVVYVPNAPYTVNSNVSTFTPSYTDALRDEMITNGLNAATQGNSSLDAEWPACVACAVLSRSFDRTGTTVPDACTTCFTRYCWNGTLDTTDPAGEYEPSFKIANVTADSAGARAFGVDVAGGGSFGIALAAVLGSVSFLLI